MKRVAALSLIFLAVSAAALAAAPLPSSWEEASKLLDEVVRLTRGGFSDQTILTFLRARRGQLPAVITARDFANLRSSGVAERVIGYLSGAAAIELETAGRTAAMDSEPAPTRVQPPETYPAVVAYPYPYGGGYVAPRHFPRPHPSHLTRVSAQPPMGTAPRIGPNGFPILASPGSPGSMPLPIGPNGFPVPRDLSGPP